MTAYEQPLVAFNRYRYANNNPYKFTDPDGRFGTSIERAIDRDIMARASGEISDEEYFDRTEARAAGGVAGLAILAGARSPGLLRSALKWSVQRAIARQAARRPDGVPRDWERTPSADGKGYVWRNPENPKHDYVRTSTGDPKSSNPGQQRPYIERRANGKRYDKDNEIVPNQSEASHVRPEEFKFKPADQLPRK